MKIDKRFADKIGAEYALFPLAAPHYEECQQRIAAVVGNHLDTWRDREEMRSFWTVLEIGCGIGHTTLELNKRLPWAFFTALDAEQVMIDQAERLLQDCAQLICADALEYLMGLPDESQDAVVTGFCLHNMPPEYRVRVFWEMGRVLRPGGIIVNGDKIAQDDIQEHQRCLREQIDAFSVFQTTEYPELQEEWTAHYLEDDKIRSTEDEQRKLFKFAGCRRITCHARWCMDAIFSGTKPAR